MDSEYMELVDLTALLKEGIESVVPGIIWVKAEISELNLKRNGHCYLELSQTEGGTVVAKVRATIWASRWNYIDQYFKREVLPYAPDAWIDTKKTKIGYEIPMTRYFYEYKAPEPIEDIMARITDLEADISKSLQALFHKEA